MRHWVLMYETPDDKITWTSIALSGTSYQTFVLSCKNHEGRNFRSERTLVLQPKGWLNYQKGWWMD